MKRVEALFLVSSPLQALFAYSAKQDFDLSDDKVLMLHIKTSHNETNKQTSSVIKLFGWKNHRVLSTSFSSSIWTSSLKGLLRRISLKRILKIGSKLSNQYDFKLIFMGDYREPYMRHFCGLFPTSKIILLDDGSITPQVASYRNKNSNVPKDFDTANFSLKRFLSKQKDLTRHFKLDEPKSITYYSIYRFKTDPGSVIKSPVSILRLFETKAWEIVDEVWLIGNNHVENRITTDVEYFKLLDGYEAFFKGRVIRYFPHRKESREKLAEISRCDGFYVEHVGIPLELYMYSKSLRPSVFVGTASTLIDSLKFLFEGNQMIFCFHLPDSYLCGKRKKHIQLIQRYHEGQKVENFFYLPPSKPSILSYEEVVNSCKGSTV